MWFPSFLEQKVVDKVESRTLVEAGLAAMQRAGRSMSRLPSRGRSMIYGLQNGETVRVRTCNDHVLIVVADSPSPDASLNIEGTDWLLVAMPERERTRGNITAYLIPTKEAAAEARRSHRSWLARNPKTAGDNRTWTLWFRPDGDGTDYSAAWAKYRLAACDSVVASSVTTDSSRPSSINVEVENARRKIAEVAGVPIQAVKITINFDG